MNDFEEKEQTNNSYYDIFDDWPLIEASFAEQYGIRLRQEDDMRWDEFSYYLSGLSYETALGRIVAIRSEKNKNVIKNFTLEQKNIRREWREKQAKSVKKENYKQAMENFEEMFAKAFGEESGVNAE
ncbi:MAG: Gp15 family bacteriophage protein [Eubacterium sp.]